MVVTLTLPAVPGRAPRRYEWVDRGGLLVTSGHNPIHTAQGIVMMVIGVLLLAGLDRLLQSLLPQRGRWRPRWVASSSLGDVAPSPPGPWPRLTSIGLLFLALTLSSGLIQPWKTTPVPWLAPAKLPSRVGDWDSSSLKLDKDLLGSVFASRWTHREYVRGQERVAFFAASDDRTHRSTSLLSAKTALPASGLDILEVGRANLEPEGCEVDVFLLARGDLRFLSYRWSVGLEGVFSESVRGLLALDRSAWRSADRTIVYRVSSEIMPTPGGREKAEKRLRDFIRALRPELARLNVPLEF